jgi:hypothetical protein
MQDSNPKPDLYVPQGLDALLLITPRCEFLFAHAECCTHDKGLDSPLQGRPSVSQGLGFNGQWHSFSIPLSVHAVQDWWSNRRNSNHHNTEIVNRNQRSPRYNWVVELDPHGNLPHPTFDLQATPSNATSHGLQPTSFASLLLQQRKALPSCWHIQRKVIQACFKPRKALAHLRLHEQPTCQHAESVNE